MGQEHRTTFDYRAGPPHSKTLDGVMSWLIEYWYVVWGLIGGSIFISIWVYAYRHRGTSLGPLLRYCGIRTVRSAWVLLLGSVLMFLFPICVLLAYPEQIAPVPEERVSDIIFFSVFLSIWFPITGSPVALASWALFSSRGRQYLNEQETLSGEKPRRLRSLTLLLLVFAPATLLSTKLFEVYSKHIELPAITAGTAPNVLTSSCRDYKSALSDRAPKHCEFVQTSRSVAGDIRETFYFSDGSVFALESRNGRWKSSANACPALERQGWLSGVGMLLLAVAMLARLVRTRQFFYLPGMPMNDFESIAAAYGACLFAGWFVGVALAECSAMAVPL